MAPLDDPRAKLARADEHRLVLETAMRQLLDGTTLTVVERSSVTVGQDKKVQPTYELRDMPEMPEQWGLIIGDFAHNARAALDRATSRQVVYEAERVILA